MIKNFFLIFSSKLILLFSNNYFKILLQFVKLIGIYYAVFKLIDLYKHINLINMYELIFNITISALLYSATLNEDTANSFKESYYKFSKFVHFSGGPEENNNQLITNSPKNNNISIWNDGNLNNDYSPNNSPILLNKDLPRGDVDIGEINYLEDTISAKFHSKGAFTMPANVEMVRLENNPYDCSYIYSIGSRHYPTMLNWCLNLANQYGLSSYGIQFLLDKIENGVTINSLGDKTKLDLLFDDISQIKKIFFEAHFYTTSIKDCEESFQVFIDSWTSHRILNNSNISMLDYYNKIYIK